jgi:hypothetical protein
VKRYTILLLLILAAFFLRVWQLPQIPPGLWYDEAYNALDAVWMAETKHYPVFFVGNNGREPMWHYLVMLSTSLLGNTPFAVRWVGTLAGVLTVPIIYCFAFSLLRPFSQNKRHRHWLALTAAGWLTVSWWHLLNSRSGYRPVLLPLLLMLSLYFFWRGWELRDSSYVSRITYHVSRLTYHVSRITFYFILAGLFLGLSQYTYLPARLAPLIFVGFAVLWSFQTWRVKTRRVKNGNIKQLWLGLLVTLLVATLICAPLGLFYLNNPETFSSRTGDVVFAPKTFGEVTVHLLQGVSLFLGAGHELYRHHLPGRAMLGWLEIPFFWVGLISLLRPARLRRPETQLILLGFVVMWLPALLAFPPVHSLRPIGLLPFYYLIVTLGLSQLARITYHVSRITYHVLRNKRVDRYDRIALRPTPYVLPLAFTVFITLNGLFNVYDYFQKWADHPETYKEFNTPLVDLTHYLAELTQTRDVIIPFHLYVHPTTRYLLWHTFPEQAGPPPLTQRPVEMLLLPDPFQVLYVGNIPQSSALVLLTRDATGQGAAYVSRSPRATEQTAINDGLASLQTQLRPFRDKLGRAVAHLVLLPDQGDQPSPKAQISNLFDLTPLRTIDLNWADIVRLEGYDVTPQLAQPGQPITLNFYWHSLTDKTFEHRLFLQLLDSAGNPINQWEGDAFREDMYRWRPDGILTTQHTLWPGPDVDPGPYLVRLGFFDEVSGERLPLQEEAGPTSIDQVQLGLFYVSLDDTDPRQPTTPLSAAFADSIELIGFTLTPYSLLPTPYSTLPVTIHWQTIQPTDKPYTVFLQLLNEQGEVISGWDRQPFDGLYPTNLWSPGEIIADTFHLPLPEAGLPSGKYRLITGFYDFDTGQRLPVVDGGDFAELGEFVVD